MSDLAVRITCRHCAAPVVLASCSDGRRRTFDPDTISAASRGVWAWLRGRGMTEVDDHHGHRLHWCAEFDRVHPRDVLPRPADPRMSAPPGMIGDVHAPARGAAPATGRDPWTSPTP